MTIGFIGLGHMGFPMATNLLQKGHRLVVYDVIEEPLQMLTEKGAECAPNLQHLAKACNVIITMLPSGSHVKNVYAGEEGILAHVSKESMLIESSTIAVQEAYELQKLVLAKGLRMVDAPVSGGVAAAKAATLTFMVGGDVTNFNQVAPLLNDMGKTVIHAGKFGSGQAAKVCNNMLLGISMIGVSEMFLLGKQLGLDPHKLFEIVSKASGQCWSLTQYCPMPNILPNVPSSHEYAPGFTAAMMLKDLRLSQQAAQMVETATPLGAMATALYGLLATQGYAAFDFSVMLQWLSEPHEKR